MKRFMRNWGCWTCLGMIACSLSLTGCKSGWKMPGKDLFSWNKKPSENTIAGKGPSLTVPPSPASNHAPTAVASTGPSGPSTKTSPFSTAGYNPTTTPGTSPANPTSANGYQVGPYGMAGTSGSSGTPTAAPGLANNSATNPVLGGNSAVAGSGYGIPAAPKMPTQYANNSPGLPAVQTYGGASNNPYGYSAPPANMTASSGVGGATPSTATPGLVSPGAPGTGFTPPPGNMASSGYPQPTTNYSNALMGSSPNPNVAASGTSAGNYGSAGTSGTNVGYAPSTNYAGTVTNPYAASNGVANAGGYRPGSTSRTTSYDITQPAGASMATTTPNTNLIAPPSGSLPGYTPSNLQQPPMMATPPSGFQQPTVIR